jgi:hypothetical protein
MADGGRSMSVSEGYRVCARCGDLKPLSEYHNSRTGQFTYCRDCRNEYDRGYYKERGRAVRLARRRVSRDNARLWMADIKSGIPCVDCGQTFPVYVMHWDHLPEFRKVGDVSAMVSSRPREVVLEELKKCELVCANCHVMRTVARATRAS